MCLEIINNFIWVDGHEHHHVEVIKNCTPHLWMFDFLHGAQVPCFQHMPCAKKIWDMISIPYNPAMVHPTLVCLPWTINILWNPCAKVVPKHKTMQQNFLKKCTTYCNVRSSCGASFTMKHDGFPMWHMQKKFCPHGIQPFHQVFTYLPTHDNPNDWHLFVMEIKRLQCE